jgi:transposase
VQSLYRAGMTIAEIARTMSMSRNTASKYLRADDFPERLPNPPGPASLLPYHAHLAERWQERCHNGRILWEEVRAMGYPGSIQTVQRYLASWRLHPRRGPSPLPPTPLSPATPHQAAQLTWYALKVSTIRISDPAHAGWAVTAATRSDE